MRSARRVGWVVLLVLLALTVLLVRERQALAAVLVELSDFEQVAPRVYFAPRIPRDERTRVLEALRIARGRVAGLFGALGAQPTVIVADEATLARFASGTVGLTHYQPTGPVVVVGPAGQNADVLAHELAHAELFARLGYRKLGWCVPTWFDEGLAVQLDGRPFVSEQAYGERVAQGWHLPPLETLATRGDFFAGSRDEVRFHYAGARVAVATWLRTVTRQAALASIASLDCGDEARRTLARIAGSVAQRAAPTGRAASSAPSPRSSDEALRASRESPSR